MNKNTQLKKEMLLEGLVKSLGIITNACAIANVSRTSYYSYYKDDDEFAKEDGDVEINDMKDESPFKDYKENVLKEDSDIDIALNLEAEEQLGK